MVTKRAEAASQRALRYGAPLAAVDPLVSLLFDLARLQADVLAALEALGVPAEELPPPFGSGARAAPAAEADSGSGGTEGALAEYCAAAGCPGAAPARATAAVLDALCAGIADVEQRRVLASLACGGGEAPRLHASPDGAPPAKRPRTEPSGGTADGEWAEVDVAALAECCARCEDRVAAAAAKSKELLRALCSPSLSGTLSCHAKYVEVTREELEGDAATPACQALKTNYEELIVVNDAFAGMQRRLHEGLATVTDALQRYCAESAVVAGRERRYWRHVGLLEKEYAALVAIRASLRTLRRSLKRAAKS